MKMKLWHWIIGKGKKGRNMSFVIPGVLSLIALAVIWIIENNAMAMVIEQIAYWIISIIIYWALWRFLVFLFNIRR